jgi:non-homologous end joining protein Ku
LIDAKVEGREIAVPEEEEEPEVINLMDALRQSIALTQAGPKSSRRSAKRSKKGATKRRSASRRKRAS